MKFYQLSHLGDVAVRQGLHAAVGEETTATAKIVAFLAEFDARKLYREDGYPSTRNFCVEVLRLSDDAACRSIQAARAARQFPAIFESLADRRLHLTGVNLLAPYLTHSNAEKMLKEAAHKTKVEIEILISERFPRSEEMALVETLPAAIHSSAMAPAESGTHLTELSSQPALARVLLTNSRVEPIAPERYALHLSVPRELREKLRHAQDLLGHSLPSGDIAEVLSLALDALISRLEKRKFAATPEPRRCQPPAMTNGRHIPASVRRAVRERDGDRCTVVSATGHRCQARRFLEFDHIREFARGGEATVENIRLRCRPHNQYAAELTYGARHMQDKRDEARRIAKEVRGQAPDGERAKRQRIDEVIPWLLALRCSPTEARRAAERCESIPDASLEERVRLAVSQLGPKPRSVG